jgi:hypothetical protein
MMKKIALVLLLSLFATVLSLSTLARSARAQGEPAGAATAGSATGEEQAAPTAEHHRHHRSHGEVAITKTCGCAAECPDKFKPTEATSCYTEGGTCKENGAKCTLTCKNGTEERKIDGKCTAVYK